MNSPAKAGHDKDVGVSGPRHADRALRQDRDVPVLAAFCLLVTFDNITDYGIELSVRAARAEHGHDLPRQQADVPGDHQRDGYGRSPTAFIIPREGLTGILFLAGAIGISWQARNARGCDFNEAKRSPSPVPPWPSSSGSSASWWWPANGSPCGSRRPGTAGRRLPLLHGGARRADLRASPTTIDGTPRPTPKRRRTDKKQTTDDAWRARAVIAASHRLRKSWPRRRFSCSRDIRLTFGGTPLLDGAELVGRAGRAAVPGRPQRLGQVDAAQDRRRADRARSRHALPAARR